MNEPIFSHTGLSDDHEHELVVTVSPSTSFLLDHLVYTRPARHNASAYYLPTIPTITPPASALHATLGPRAEEAS